MILDLTSAIGAMSSELGTAKALKSLYLESVSWSLSKYSLLDLNSSFSYDVRMLDNSFLDLYLSTKTLSDTVYFKEVF